MSRQLDLKEEERGTAKRNALVKALEFGLVGALESQGIEFLGLSIRYEAFSCLLTLRAIKEETRVVAFARTDTMINCILTADSAARRHALSWGPDKFHEE